MRSPQRHCGLGGHHANTPLLVNGPPIALAAPNSVLRRGEGDR
jgi:hypothetical protein